MSGRVTQFLGDSPLRVAVKLAVVSLIVGVVMSAFGWTPWDVFDNLYDLVMGLWNMGWRAVERFASYFLLGAAIVIPAFIVLRILNLRR